MTLDRLGRPAGILRLYLFDESAGACGLWRLGAPA